MGFWTGIRDTFAKPFNAGGNAVEDIAGGNNVWGSIKNRAGEAGSAFGFGNDQKPKVDTPDQGPPGVDPRLQAIRNAQTKQAKDYRANLGNYQSEAYRGIQGDVRRDLAQKMVGMNRDYNNKGLLYSGLRQGAQGQAAANAAGSLSQARSEINRESENRAKMLEENALRGELGLQQQGVDIQDRIYEEALRRTKERNDAIGGGLSAAGYAAGTYAGSR